MTVQRVKSRAAFIEVVRQWFSQVFEEGTNAIEGWKDEVENNWTQLMVRTESGDVLIKLEE